MRARATQVAVEAKLPLVRRVFDRLYSPSDFFLYVADSRLLATHRVEVALGLADRGRANVKARVGARGGCASRPRGPRSSRPRGGGRRAHWELGRALRVPGLRGDARRAAGALIPNIGPEKTI